MDVEEALDAVDDVKRALYGTRGSRLDMALFKLAEGIRLADSIASATSPLHLGEALGDYREWRGWEREATGPPRDGRSQGAGEAGAS